MVLQTPTGYRSHRLSEPRERARVEGWTAGSRERTLYHTPAYVEFARQQNGRGDLLWLTREGAPVLGVPVHPAGRARIGTGYAGLLFPANAGEAQLRRGASALVDLLSANRRLGFQALQCVQAPAYADRAHMAGLACELAAHHLSGPPLYSRVLALEPPEDGKAGTRELDLGEQRLLACGLDGYQAELRNQIRQAVRRGLHATCALPLDAQELPAAYEQFEPLHRESWQRTGMTPHPLDYWLALARSVLGGGGRDLLVFARDGGGRAVAAVGCHLYGDSALYWSGASSERGLAMRANPLCLHAAIQACRQLGVRRFELGRFNAREPSPKERAITRYKAQFGGELVRVVCCARLSRGARWAARLRSA